MTSVSTALILTGRADEASRFYASALGTEVTRRVPDGHGGVLLATLEVAGHEIVVINGTGPEADVRSQRVTLQIHVDGQREFDRYWYALLDGGVPSQNGWLVDRYGVWWNVVPVQQMQLFARASTNSEVLGRLGAAATSMHRIDIDELERIVSGG